MKRLLLFLFLGVQIPLMAQKDSLDIRRFFMLMPDSLTPYLTANNRLDMIDFMDAHMKAIVKNELGSDTEMTFLSDDSLCIIMSNALTIELWQGKEDKDVVLYLKRTYQISKKQKEVLLQRFTSSWGLLSATSLASSLLEREDEVFEKSGY